MERIKHKFIRYNSNRKKRVSENWRRPKGHQNKARLNLKGRVGRPTVGHKSPILFRGTFRKEQLVIVNINNEKDLACINPEKEAVIMGHVGRRKRLVLVKECVARKIKILNIKNPADYIKNVIESLEEAKKKRAERKSKKLKKVETPEKKKEKDKVDETKKKSETLTLDEKKIIEKKEKDKILTHKT